MLDGCRTKLFAGLPHRVRTRSILLALHIFHFGRLPRGDALTLELNAVTVMALVGACFRGHNPQACASTYVNRFDLYLSLSISRIHAHTNFFSLRYHLTNPAYNYTFHHASIGVIFWALKHRNIVVLNTARHLVNTHTHTHTQLEHQFRDTTRNTVSHTARILRGPTNPRTSARVCGFIGKLYTARFW